MIDFFSTCRDIGGCETKSRDVFQFHDANRVELLISQLGHSDFRVPESLRDREILVEHRAGDFFIHCKRHKNDAFDLPSTFRAGFWTLVLRQPENQDSIRLVVRRDEHGHGSRGRWMALMNDGTWCEKYPSAIKTILQAKGHAKPEAERIMGDHERDAWTEVCIPFAGPNPGERQWNINAPQYRYQPIHGEHPTWDMIHDHIGRSLDDYYPGGGRLYLQRWLAWMLRKPECRLPYLFMYGPENSGKSIAWESVDKCLITGGVFKADRALTSQSDFNGELDGCVLAVIEEKEISRWEGVSAKIKDAVTSPTLSIRRMRTDTYQVPNYSHFVQTANTRSACTIPIGDTRFVVLEVQRPAQDIPKPILLERLNAEAPAFLWSLLNMELPEPTGRLALPAIDTPEKLAVQEENLPPFILKLVDYLEQHKHWKGTATDFKREFGGNCDRLPRLKDALSKFAPYLDSQKISFTYPERIKAGMPVEFTCNV